MANFEISDPQANQILVYDEISSSFINVDYNVPTSVGGLNIGSTGVNIFNDVSGNKLRFKSITSDGSLTLTEHNSSVEISFNGNATTLNGLDSSDFVLSGNDLSDINSINARNNLNIYSIDECHDEFMGLNTSNVPDTDNVYDLGSNGRRYADIYAKTFHGDATNALIAERLSRNGALDNQVLVWSDDNQRWIPTAQRTFSVSSADDVNTVDLRDGSILRFNANNNRWEPIVFDADDSGNNIADIENLGNGLGVFKNRTGFIANYRSLSAGSNIDLRYNFNDEEIIIEADVPQNTNQLSEGSLNLYYTNDRFDDRFSNSSIRGLRDVQTGTPNINQTLVWNGSEFTFRTVIVDVSNTDDIPEGNTNLYYTTQRVQATVNDYFNNNGFALTNISDVNATHVNGHVLYSQGGSWINKKLDIDDLQNFNLGSLSDGDTIVWQGDNDEFIKTKLPSLLRDLGDDSQSEHFNNTTFNTKISGITTDSINEGTNNRYLSEPTLLDVLNGVSIDSLTDINLSGVNNGDSLVWNSSSSAFLTTKLPTALIDLSSSPQSEHFTTSSFMSKVTTLDTDDIVEGTNNTYFTKARFNDEFNISSILNLSDVNAVNLSDGNVLTWDSANSEFIAVSVESITSDISELSDLNDVNFDPLTLNAGDILIWDTSTDSFVGGTPKTRLSQLNDVNFSALSNNDILVYNGSTFINEPKLPYSVTNATDGDILVWSSNQFINVDISTLDIGDINLDEISNVSFDYENINTGDVLLWDDLSGNFTVGDISPFVDITNINGVILNGIGNGDSLRWDGTEFVNSYIPRFDNSKTPNSQDVLLYNSGTSSYVGVNKWSIMNINYSTPIDKSTFIYDQMTGQFNISKIELDDISNINDVSQKIDGSNYVLVWSDANNTHSITRLNFFSIEGINVVNIQDNQVLKWDASSSEFKNELLTLSDFEDVTLNNLQENEVLYWDGTAFTNGIPTMSCTTFTPTTNTIIPQAATYQLLTPSTDTTYLMDIVTLSNNTAYEFKMVLSNATNYVVDFISSGTIEYVGGLPVDFNGKFIITAVTFNGTDWIFDVSESIS